MLRGLGVTMALPWMESHRVWGDEPRGNQRASEAPVRLAVMFSGNGFHSKEWWAREENGQLELGKVLEPLSDFRQKMLYISGLFNAEALKGNIHSSQTGNLLSGAPLASGGEIRSGTSIDQLFAQRHGRETKVPSLVLGCEKSNPSVHKNYSMLYSSHISWSSPTTPTSPMTANYLIVLFRTYGIHCAVFGLMGSLIAVTAFRRGERWAWWTLLASNTMALVSAMRYDWIVNAIGPFELTEYLGLALVLWALAVTAPFVAATRPVRRTA